MHIQRLPNLEAEEIAGTRDALHAYARVLGSWLKNCRPKRKHWWHASLRSSLNGLTTGVVHGAVSFELELNLRMCQLHGRASSGQRLNVRLHGQSAAELAESIQEFLCSIGMERKFVPDQSQHSTQIFYDFSSIYADNIGTALSFISAVMETFRASIPEETSPVQLWPHHFDLSMLWLPGDKIPEQDPENEDYADKQMNFGFVFGDSSIPEPYFYITAYPLPEAFPDLILPTGASWHSDGFSGVVADYHMLKQVNDPYRYLLNLWNLLLAAGRQQMLTNVQ